MLVAAIAIVGIAVLWWTSPSAKKARQKARENRAWSVYAKHLRDASLLPMPTNPLVPVAGDWVLMGYNKTRMMSSRSEKLTGLSAIPHAIHANRKNYPKGVSAMFDTLIQLVGDPDEEVAVTAALQLHGLGDYKSVAIKRLGEFLKRLPPQDKYPRYEYYPLTFVNLSGGLLEAMASAKDHRLDDAIYTTWTMQSELEDQLAHRIEYAEYLERAGRQLPEEYWANRAERGLQFARELLRDR